MLKITTEYRVQYADTDMMGVMYHANYLVCFERGRNELMRAAGYPYRRCEAEGWMLPVIHTELDYHAPAKYDDLLEITAWVQSCRGVRMEVACEIRRKGEAQLLVSGFTRHCFVASRDFRPVRPPKSFADLFLP